jgi:hypothetical protein
MFRKRRKCDFPPCDKPAYPHSDEYNRRPCDGECDRHGHWETCSSHSWVDHSRDRVYKCPVCQYEEAQQFLADEAEAKRRNSSNPPSPYSGYVEEYTRQGYGQEAAEALAEKQLRGNPPPPTMRWFAQDIKKERDQQERQQKIEQGTLAVCPSCRKDVLVSDWIILSHQAWTGKWGPDPSGFRASEAIMGTCPGTGSSVR